MYAFPCIHGLSLSVSPGTCMYGLHECIHGPYVNMCDFCVCTHPHVCMAPMCVCHPGCACMVPMYMWKQSWIWGSTLAFFSTHIAKAQNHSICEDPSNSFHNTPQPPLPPVIGAPICHLPDASAVSVSLGPPSLPAPRTQQGLGFA